MHSYLHFRCLSGKICRYHVVVYSMKRNMELIRQLKNETLPQRRCFQFSHCKFPFICNNRIAANKEATSSRMHSGYVEVITSEVLRSPP